MQRFIMIVNQKIRVLHVRYETTWSKNHEYWWPDAEIKVLSAALLFSWTLMFIYSDCSIYFYLRVNPDVLEHFKYTSVWKGEWYFWNFLTLLSDKWTIVDCVTCKSIHCQNRQGKKYLYHDIIWWFPFFFKVFNLILNVSSICPM